MTEAEKTLKIEEGNERSISENQSISRRHIRISDTDE
jgi:hypothetical protein